ncbi:MAG: alkene reductase [Filimonas sp.]|nr:alkene reductase [Filimonas sp.]
MSASLPFTSYKLGNIVLSNRMVMAPMTRCRAIDNVPNDLIAEYYSQRASTGLIITEGSSPSPNGLGYARIPGIFSKDQVEGWKKVTQAVHAKNGKIFMQMMHCGRVAHPANMPEGAKVLAPSAIATGAQIWTDKEGMQTQAVPEALTAEELQLTLNEFVLASKNAIEAGFDGIELHAANGYLLEQFISPVTNQRTDEYGGSIENRTRFVLAVVKAVSDAIGKEKTGIRLSPYGVANEMKAYDGIEETYSYLAEELQKLDIVYIHLADHSSMGAPAIPLSLKKTIRKKFRNTLILAGGYDIQSAEEDLNDGLANLIAFGRPFINNPDLKERYSNKWALNTEIDTTTFYSADKKGLTDYPFYQPKPQHSFANA